MKKQQSGFTMIELIMVIVILGILAAFAIPQFVDLGGDARRGTLQGAYGSIKSASALTHSAWLAQNNADAASVKVEGGTVAMVKKSGYPAGSAIAAAAGISSSDFAIDTDATAGTVISPKGATDKTKCNVTYKAPGETAGAVPTITLSSDLTGC